jgi:hypothetical protein
MAKSSGMIPRDTLRDCADFFLAGKGRVWRETAPQGIACRPQNAPDPAAERRSASGFQGNLDKRALAIENSEENHTCAEPIKVAQSCPIGYEKRPRFAQDS